MSRARCPTRCGSDRDATQSQQLWLRREVWRPSRVGRCVHYRLCGTRVQREPWEVDMRQEAERRSGVCGPRASREIASQID